jgi:tetratricopeptide (TPR) repeat protein
MLKYEDAIDDYSRELDFRASSQDYKRRGWANFRLEKFTDALADLTTSLHLQPDDLSFFTWIELSEIAACPDREFRAGIIQLAQRAVELNEESPQSRATRSALLRELERTGAPSSLNSRSR